MDLLHRLRSVMLLGSIGSIGVHIDQGKRLEAEHEKATSQRRGQ
jgi:hypothetical protein